MRSRLVIAAFFLVACSSLPAAAPAYQFEDPPLLDHRDQWGLRIEPGGTFLAAASFEGTGGASSLFSLEVGVSRGLSLSGHEVSMRVRPLLARDFGLLCLAGYRAYAGMDHWKTFADLDVIVPVIPGPAVGLRLAAGVMHDPNRRLGVSLSGGAFGAIGRGMVTGFDVSLGLQLRLD